MLRIILSGGIHNHNSLVTQGILYRNGRGGDGRNFGVVEQCRRFCFCSTFAGQSLLLGLGTGIRVRLRVVLDIASNFSIYRTTYLPRFLPPTLGVPRESIALKIAVASDTLSSSGVGHRTEAFDTVYPSIELFVYHI